MIDSEDVKQKVTTAAVSGAGAGVGGAGGATVGVLELAARGVATGLSAGIVIAGGATAGAALAYAAFRFLRARKSRQNQNKEVTQ